MKIKTLFFIGLSALWLSAHIFSYPRNDIPVPEPSVDFLNSASLLLSMDILSSTSLQFELSYLKLSHMNDDIHPQIEGSVCIRQDLG